MNKMNHILAWAFLAFSMQACRKNDTVVNFENTRNPVLPLQYHFPDCEAHKMPDGKLYIYGSYDKQPNVYCSYEYRVISTSDMKNWTIHPSSFISSEAGWVKDPNAIQYPSVWTSKTKTPFQQKLMQESEAKFKNQNLEEVFKDLPKDLLFAPDAIHKNGKYYLYFCLSNNSEGVAISDKPEGPFRNAKQIPVGGIDPAVFVDDDGQGYYYWGQFFGKGAKLNEDMTSIQEGTMVDSLVTEQEHFFHEGSSMRKRGDTYYYLYCSMERGKPTSLGYATSKSPLGPFTYRGIIIDNDGCDPGTWNNHGSIEEFNGQWYVFYHRSSNNSEYMRRLCIEPITFNEDGTINEVKMTSQGAGAPFAPGERIPAYTTCMLKGSAYLLSDGKGSESLKNISNNDTAVFRYVKSESAYKKVIIDASGSGKIHLLLDGKEAGYAEIKDGKTISSSFQAPAGKYELMLSFENPDKLEFKGVTLE